MESFWGSWDNSQIHYFIIIVFLFFHSVGRGTSYFEGLGVEGGVTSKLQGLAYHFYYKLRSQFNYECIFLEIKQKTLS